MPEVQAKRRAVKERRLTVDDVVAFYASAKPSEKPDPPEILNPEEWTLTNTPTGIGDCVMLTDLERAASSVQLRATTWICTPEFRTLQDFNPFHRKYQALKWASLSAWNQAYDLGPGHNFQRARRMFGLPVERIPSGCLFVPNVRKTNMVSVHLVPGPHAAEQSCFHPRPRQVYPENLDVLRQFVKAHPELEFFEVGGRVLNDCMRNLVSAPLRYVIPEMASCCLHIGIVSGPYHIAAALGVRTIVILNFPEPWSIRLPVLLNMGVVEEEWLYPQSHILHQDHDSPHWPKFNLRNLERAMDFDVYPYETPEKFAELITS